MLPEKELKKYVFYQVTRMNTEIDVYCQVIMFVYVFTA